MLAEALTVDMCVTIRKGCPIDYLITGDGQAEFSLGGRQGGFHYAFDAPALRSFIAVAAEALAALGAQQQVNGKPGNGARPGELSA